MSPVNDELPERRQLLRDARDQAEGAEAQASAARVRLAELEAELKAYGIDPGAPPAQPGPQAAALLARHAKARVAMETREGARAQARGAALQALAAFAPFTDPRQVLRRMSDEVPFLLFPLRVETRFGTASVDGVAQRQLWVRVYPDDCSVDTFEATLTGGELESARGYWTQWWRAGGTEAGRRAAWRGVVAAHGSGRAAWIVENYRPTNPGDEPVKAEEHDVVLVVPAAPPPEAGLLETYWRAVWLADGSRAAEEAALAGLAAVVGQARAAELAAGWKPVNLDEAPAPPRTKAEVKLSVAYVVFPPPPGDPRRHAWSRAPKVAAFPDRLMLLAYSGTGDPLVIAGAPIPTPLVAGPDPYAPPAERFREDDGDLVVPDDMRWMVDFDRAVQVGMGFRVKLTDEQAKLGFRRLLVLGVRASATPDEARQELEALLLAHQRGRSGFQLVPQGTPTNNTEAAGAGFTRGDDPDASYDDFHAPGPLFEPSTDWFEKRDGEWLAEWLGIDPAVLAKTRHAGGRDQAEARAMNAALWPATLGYWMETMLHPVFPVRTVEDARHFFTRWVSGRGAVPAVRIGRQPYGILPTTAFSRIGWLAPTVTTMGAGGEPGEIVFLRGLYPLLRALDADWAKLAGDVSYAGRPDRDAHQALLDIVGLHPGSVDYVQRYAESVEELFNRLKLSGLGGLLSTLVVAGLVKSGTDLLARLGWTGRETPDLLRKFFFTQPNAIGPLVDDRPLSETDPVRAYTPAGKNYLEWLITAAGTSLDALRRQDGFTGGKPPRALLYLLLRHALQTGYYDASLRLHHLAGALPEHEARLARRESPFVHVAAQAARSESRYHWLYRHDPTVTAQAPLSVADYITANLPALFGTRYLWEQLRALETLKCAPTARLERALAEHLDLCTYRLDGWMQGVVHWQLGRMRDLREGGQGGEPQRGVHLGAYAWLENVVPENRVLSAVQLEGEQGEVFQRPGEPPLMRDSANQGFVHAPSLNQAVTAAVLRNGYLSGAGPAGRPQFAVNLTSERVRAALGVLEGIREGQSLGALLGYQLERGLHDRHALAEVDKYIYDLRKAFPLRANRLKRTRAPGEPITALEARNVVDGLRLAEQVKDPAHHAYPFGVDLPADATPDERKVLEAEVERLLDTHDAVADLAIAEGVFQAVQGNYDRVSANLDAYARGGFPPEPEVVRTPASGTTLTHRVGLHLEAGAGSADADSPVARKGDPTQKVPMTPRAQAEPALNRWLAGVLPRFEDVACTAVFHAAAGNAVTEAPVTLFDLGVQPIDVLHLLHEGRQGMSELDDRVVQHTLAAHAVRPDGGVQVRYIDAAGAPLSFFQLLPLVRTLRRLVLASRPLKASDLALANRASQGYDQDVSASRARVVLAQGALQGVRAGLEALRAALAAPLSDLPARRGDVVAGVDSWVQQTAARLLAASRFGVAGAGAGFVHAWHARQFGAVLARVAGRVQRWDDRLAEFDVRLAAYDALAAETPDDERFSLLQQAERLVAPGVTQPRPATPVLYRAQLNGRRTTLANRRDDLAGLLLTTYTAVGPLLDDVRARLPVSDVDALELTLVEEEDEVVRFAQDALRAVKGVLDTVDARLADAAKRLLEHDAAAEASARVAALTAMAKELLGDDFVLVPEFGVKPAQGDELASAVGASGALLGHLTGTVGIDFPVDEWLYGAARVRDKLRAWEEVVMVAGGFGRPEPALTPLQLPFRAGDRWLALQFQPGYELDGDRLLYTAHFSAPFQKAGRQCGLLLDEWTEVIPGDEATTGLVFHYDRPNSEPPQAMLLVTPTAFRGGWTWDDLVDALNETLENARKRAVEPGQVDGTPYARFLPATLTAATVSQLTIGLNLALTNSVQDLLKTS